MEFQLLILVDIISIVLGTSTGQYPLTETCLCVTGRDIPARNSSGLSGKIIAWLNKPSCFLFNRVIDQTPDQAWYQLQDVYGHNLWVSGRHLIIEPTANCSSPKASDCQDVLDNRISSPTNDNIYTLDRIDRVLGSRKLSAKCEFSSNVGWTVLMHRDSGHLDFDDKDSTQYALGFGNARDEFWMGLEYMHALTSDGQRYQLRVDLTVANGSQYYQLYDNFMVGPPNKFTLYIGRTSGTAGDSLSGHNNFGFTTKDRDQDANAQANCALYVGGGWWFHNCFDSCLTCNYITPGTKDCRSMSWQTLGYCVALKAVTMKIRPL